MAPTPREHHPRLQGSHDRPVNHGGSWTPGAEGTSPRRGHRARAASVPAFEREGPLCILPRNASASTLTKRAPSALGVTASSCHTGSTGSSRPPGPSAPPCDIRATRMEPASGGLLPTRQHAPACQRQAGPGAAVPLRGSWRTGAGAFVASGGRPHRLPDEAPTAGRHHTPLLHRAGTLTARGIPGASTTGEPHEVSWHLRSRRETSAISAPPSGGRVEGTRGEPSAFSSGEG